MAAGIANPADVRCFTRAFDHASWLNPVIGEGTYQVHALSVACGAGQTVGMQLLSNAIESARQQGFGKLQLDVLSDNPAVNLPVYGLILACGIPCLIPERHGAT